MKVITWEDMADQICTAITNHISMKELYCLFSKKQNDMFLDLVLETKSIRRIVSNSSSFYTLCKRKAAYDELFMSLYDSFSLKDIPHIHIYPIPVSDFLACYVLYDYLQNQELFKYFKILIPKFSNIFDLYLKYIRSNL